MDDIEPRYFRLQGTEIVPCDLFSWSRSMEERSRVIRQDWIGGQFVSTVFLGLVHGFDGERPILFETMVFHGPMDQEQLRCCTYAEALEMHAATLARVRNITPWWRRFLASELAWWHTGPGRRVEGWRMRWRMRRITEWTNKLRQDRADGKK